LTSQAACADSGSGTGLARGRAATRRRLGGEVHAVGGGEVGKPPLGGAHESPLLVDGHLLEHLGVEGIDGVVAHPAGHGG